METGKAVLFPCGSLETQSVDAAAHPSGQTALQDGGVAFLGGQSFDMRVCFEPE